MNKHTPGPWELDESGVTVQTIDDTGWEIADIRADVPGFEANADLLVSAPDLLEALEDSLTALNIVYPSGSPVLNAATHAIAKARGQS